MDLITKLFYLLKELLSIYFNLDIFLQVFIWILCSRHKSVYIQKTNFIWSLNTIFQFLNNFLKNKFLHFYRFWVYK